MQARFLADANHPAGLVRAGGLAALAAGLIFRRNLDAEWTLLRGLGVFQRGPTAPPVRIEDWLALLQQKPLLGVTLLNLFDVVNFLLMALLFAALYATLRRERPGWAVFALGLGLAGALVNLAANQALSLLSLSHQVADAGSAAQRSLLISGGQALLALHRTETYAGQGLYPSHLLVSLGGLVFALLILRSRYFKPAVGIVGILAFGCALAYYPVLAWQSDFVALPVSASAVFLLAWDLWLGIRLWRIGAPADPVRAASPAASR